LKDFKIMDYPRKEINTKNPQLKLDIGIWFNFKIKAVFSIKRLLF
jgi:hypothetical protein